MGQTLLARYFCVFQTQPQAPWVAPAAHLLPALPSAPPPKQRCPTCFQKLLPRLARAGLPGVWGPRSGAVSAELRLSWAGGKVSREVRAPSYKLHRCSQDAGGVPFLFCQTEAVAEAHPVLGGPDPQTHLKARPCPVPPTTTL